MPRIPVALYSYLHRYNAVSAQRLLNWMPERQPRDAKAPVVLLPTPGAVSFARCGTVGPCRGMHVMGAHLYAAVGAAVWRVDVSGATLRLGLIDAGAGAVRMADNNAGQLAIVVPDTGNAWIATSTTLAQITDEDFPDVSDVAFLDGYFAFARQDSQRFVISSLNDGTTYDALDFASAESAPDNLVACERVGRNLWLLGERSTEVWENSGNSDFPFTRQYGGAFDRGIAARCSLAVRDTAAYWLADNRTVVRADGGKPMPISTPVVEQAIAGYEVISDACGWCYDQEGHEFYVLSFPAQGATWVYDNASQAWHERESEGYDGLWRASFGAAFAGAIIVGDATTSDLAVLTPTAYAEADGSAIVRVATGAPLSGEGKRLFHQAFELDCQTGVGLQVGQGSDPQVWLQWSDDAGRTWSSERWADLGAVGRSGGRVVWRRLGAARNRTYRVGMSDPVGTALIAANIDAAVGSH